MPAGACGSGGTLTAPCPDAAQSTRQGQTSRVRAAEQVQPLTWCHLRQEKHPPVEFASSGVHGRGSWSPTPGVLPFGTLSRITGLSAAVLGMAVCLASPRASTYWVSAASHFPGCDSQKCIRTLWNLPGLRTRVLSYTDGFRPLKAESICKEKA